MTYRHTQTGTVIIAAVLGAMLLVIFIAAKEPGTLRFPVLFFAVFAGIALALFASLTVEIDGDKLVCKFGIGIIRKKILLSEITRAESVVNPWYVGWGIRWLPGKCWVWNVSGLRAVELTMTGGRRFRIGTDEPEALVSAIMNSKRNPRRG